MTPDVSANGPTVCVRCLLRTDIPGVFLDEDGLCNYCRAEPLFVPAESRQRCERLLDRCRRLGHPLAVALSGGNDSASCLIHLVRSGFPCIAIMVDNGFIPVPVLDRARAICDRLGVQLIVERFDLLERLGPNFSSPCEVCIAEVLVRVGRRAVAQGAAGVATGHLYGPAFEVIDIGAGAPVPRITPLFLARVPELQRDRMLADEGWTALPRYGSSSNCLLLGYIEYLYHREWGYSPAIAEVSHEIRAGSLKRSEAEAKLAAAPLWREEYADVERALGQ